MPRRPLRPNRLPVAPPPLRHRVHSPSAAPRETSLERVRRLARQHRAEEKPFDPEKRGTWRGSSRDLVVNASHRRGNRYGHEAGEGEETFLVIIDDNNSTEWVVVNPLECPIGKWSKERLFAYQLGAVGTSHFLVWGKSYEDTLEHLGDWCERYAPGHLTTEEEVGKLTQEALAEGLNEEEAYAQATADLLYTEAGYFTSYELHVDDEASLPKGLFRECEQASKEEYIEEYGSPDT